MTGDLVVLIHENKGEVFASREDAFMAHPPSRVATPPSRGGMEVWIDGSGHRFELYPVTDRMG